MNAIKITFKEPAQLQIFTDPSNYAGPGGPHQIINVAAGEVWYAPANQGKTLRAALNKQIPVEKDTYGVFHDMGAISRSTDEQAQWVRIAAVNKGLGIVVRPQVPDYEIQPITAKTLDTTNEDYWD
jgi:hypothetical protein